MAETSRGIYYPTKAVDGNQPAKVIEKMELMAESIDEAIDNAVQEATYDDTEIKADIVIKEDKSNKVTSISSSSTDTQYPSAKCVYDIVGDIESILEELDIRRWR